MEVELVCWPREQDRRERLAADGRPRLLLVDEGTSPPAVSDCLEDWIRIPSADDDVRARVDALRRRLLLHRAEMPELDGDGLLRCGGGWTSLPPVEARLMASMLERYGAVVSREHLARSGWPTGSPGRNALDVHVLRLRRRIAGLGLSIRTVRSRGYLLEAEVADLGAPCAARASRGAGA